MVKPMQDQKYHYSQPAHYIFPQQENQHPGQWDHDSHAVPWPLLRSPRSVGWFSWPQPTGGAWAGQLPTRSDEFQPFLGCRLIRCAVCAAPWAGFCGSVIIEALPAVWFGPVFRKGECRAGVQPGSENTPYPRRRRNRCIRSSRKR